MLHRLHGPESGSDGMAMVLVLWLLGMIAALALVAARLASAHNAGAVLALERAHEQFAISAVIDAAAWQIITGASETGRGSASASVGQSLATVSFENEMSRIDINRAPQALLEGLFGSVGVPSARAAQLAAAVIDWRDPDEEATSGGAERLDYGPAAPPPRNGPFIDPAEIGRVLGVTPAIAAAVEPLITVASGSDKVDARIASRSVMLALPGATPMNVASYVDAIRRGRPQAEALERLGSSAAYVGQGSSSVWRLSIAVSTGGGSLNHYEASLLVSSRHDMPYDVLRFSEMRAEMPQQPRANASGKGGKS